MSGPVTDPALLAQLDKNAESGDDAIVKALIDGRMSFPTDSRALNKPYWQQLLAKVSEKDPSFDTVDYNARKRTRQAFTSGKQGDNITSFNTVLHHIGTLMDAADTLRNHGGLATPLNAPGNYLSETFGSDKVTNFRTARKAVADEAVRAFRGVGGTGHDVQAVLENMSENASPEQIRGSLGTLANLLKGRITSLGEQYQKGMGKTSDGINLLDPEAQQVLSKLTPKKGGDPASAVAGGTDGSGTPPAPSDTPPTGGGTLVAGDVAHANEVAKPIDLTAQQRAAFQALARRGGSPEELASLLGTFGVTAADPSELNKLADALKKNPDLQFSVQNDNTVRPVDHAQDGAFGAFAGGVAKVLPFSREIGAIIDGVRNPGSNYETNLKNRYEQRAFDEQEHGVADFAGSVAGTLPLGGFEIGGARAAAAAARTAAMDSGLGAARAQEIFNRTFAMRTALDASAQSGVYSLGNADGSATDRLGAGALGAAVGGATGGALAYGGARALQALERRALGRAAAPLTDGQQTLQAAQRQDIVPFPADIGGSATRRATGAAAQTLGGVVPIRRAAQNTLDSAQAVRDRVATSLGAAANPEATGEAARAGAQQWIADTGRRIGRIYDQADAAAGGASIQTPEASRMLASELAPLRDAAVASPGVSILEGMEDRLQRPITVSSLRASRTALRSAFENAGLRGSNEERIANRVLDAASDDITNGLRAQGLDTAANQYRTADRMWRERLATIDDHLTPIIGDASGPRAKSGEQIVAGLRAAMSGNNRRFVGFLDALPANEQGIVRASLIQRLGQVSKGRQDETGEVFSLNDFLTHWNDIGETAKNRLFGAEGRAALNDLARYAAGSKEAQKFANFSNTGAAVTTSALGALLATGPVGWLTAAKSLGVSYGVGRLLSAPSFARWLGRTARVTTPQQQAQHIARLSRIARSEPVIANDVLGLQRRLSDAFNAAPARLAAEERGNSSAPVDGQQ